MRLQMSDVSQCGTATRISHLPLSSRSTHALEDPDHAPSLSSRSDAAHDRLVPARAQSYHVSPAVVRRSCSCVSFHQDRNEETVEEDVLRQNRVLMRIEVPLPLASRKIMCLFHHDRLFVEAKGRAYVPKPVWRHSGCSQSYQRVNGGPGEKLRLALASIRTGTKKQLKRVVCLKIVGCAHGGTATSCYDSENVFGSSYRRIGGWGKEGRHIPKRS